jgi:hypothetical protein
MVRSLGGPVMLVLLALAEACGAPRPAPSAEISGPSGQRRSLVTDMTAAARDAGLD